MTKMLLVTCEAFKGRDTFTLMSDMCHVSLGRKIGSREKKKKSELSIEPCNVNLAFNTLVSLIPAFTDDIFAQKAYKVFF